MSYRSIVLSFSMVFFWSVSVSLLPIMTNVIQPFWTAFIRFSAPIPFVLVFTSKYNKKYSLTKTEFLRILIISIIFIIQTFLYHAGSIGNCGGRIALFVFTYPMLVPIIMFFIKKNSHFEISKLIGAVVGFTGVILAIFLLFMSQNNWHGSFRNDLMELTCAFFIALNVVLINRLATKVNRWKILIWQFFVSSVFFLIFACLFESVPRIEDLTLPVLFVIFYQIFVIGIFCCISQQYLITEYNPSIVTIFFCFCPIISICFQVISTPEIMINIFGIILCSILVGIGIFLSQKN